MKKILFFAAVLALASSCVDKDFDLSQIVDDDLAIGSNESIFTVPLANIAVKSDALQGEDGSLESILNDANLLIPEGFGELNLQDVPVDELVNGLFDDLRKNSEAAAARRRELGEFLEGSRYRNDVVAALPPELRGRPLVDVFSDHFDVLYDRKELREEMKGVIRKALGSINDTMPAFHAEVNGFGIEEDMINLLTGAGEMRLYGITATAMPFDGKAFLVMTKNDGSGETIVRLELTLDHTHPSKDSGVIIDSDALRAMTGNMAMQVSLDLASYYPGEPLSDADNTVLKIALKLEKKGGLNISDMIEE